MKRISMFFAAVCLCLCCASAIAPPQTYIGTTPRTEAAVGLHSEEEIAISTEIYGNILACDPSLFLLSDTGLKNINRWKHMSDAELLFVKEKAAEITAGCETAEEKIFAVTAYLARNVGYDYDYSRHNSKKYKEINHSPYDVLTGKSAICIGYASTASALLQICGIPCVIVHSPNHAWNMAYTGERWLLFDPAWVSYSYYEYETLVLNENLDMDWYDFTFIEAISSANHLFKDADFCAYGNTIYTFPRYTTATRFVIPESFTVISDYAFFKCKIGELVCHGKLESVGVEAFCECAGLSGTVDLSQVKTLSEEAFDGCTGIKHLILGEGITTLPYAVFYGCSSLTSVLIPKSITSVKALAFGSNDALQTVYYIGSASDWASISTVPSNLGIGKTVNIHYDYVPQISLKKSDGKSWKTEYLGIPLGETAIFAEYGEDGKFLGLQRAPLEAEMTWEPRYADTETVKCFVWNDLVPWTELVAA